MSVKFSQQALLAQNTIHSAHEVTIGTPASKAVRAIFVAGGTICMEVGQQFQSRGEPPTGSIKAVKFPNKVDLSFILESHAGTVYHAVLPADILAKKQRMAPLSVYTDKADHRATYCGKDESLFRNFVLNHMGTALGGVDGDLLSPLKEGLLRERIKAEDTETEG